LRFRAPEQDKTLWQRLRARRLPPFEAGDLVGILPPGSASARFYSLVSSSADGMLEICVRKHTGGLCSTFLHDLEPGALIEVYIQPNPAFRPSRGKAPLIVIGAGTGVGPLAGFIRHNVQRRPVHLFWGGRDPNSDFLYRDELTTYLDDRRLTRLHTAFSRVSGGSYVQTQIALEAAEVRGLIEHGAQILVCGGREMAEGVARVLESIVDPIGLSLQSLKTGGRYIEDVY
jgi:sulfite reductase (NADPH) flavoprotein alpha-component